MPNPAKPTDAVIPAGVNELRALIERAQNGDESTLPVIRKIVETPQGVALLHGDLANRAEQAFLRMMGGDNLAFREAVTRKMEVLRTELLGPDPTPVERLLVERAVACWLHVQEADLRYARSQGSMSIRQADYHDRRTDATNRRYLAALKALALVRKLAVPLLQVNIARKQVNVAGGVINPTGDQH